MHFRLCWGSCFHKFGICVGSCQSRVLIFCGSFFIVFVCRAFIIFIYPVASPIVLHIVFYRFPLSFNRLFFHANHFLSFSFVVSFIVFENKYGTKTTDKQMLSAFLKKLSQYIHIYIYQYIHHYIYQYTYQYICQYTCQLY